MSRTPFAGRTVVVTGAARGQGASHVAALVAQGADVVATDVLDDDGAALAGSLTTAPVDGGADLDSVGHVTYRHLDVTSPEQWQALADWLASTGRRVHGLVNNAGVAQRSRVGEVDLAGWDRAIAINLTGPMLGTQAMLPLMDAGSSIVNIGSVAALGSHHGAAYTASKWGLRGFTRTSATELGPVGIRVNIVHPGYVETPLTATAPPQFLPAHLSLTPLGRGGESAEITAVVLFLLSDAAAYVSGAEIAVDGGFSAHGGAKIISDAVRDITHDHSNHGRR